jgi:hypothetical protein
VVVDLLRENLRSLRARDVAAEGSIHERLQTLAYPGERRSHVFIALTGEKSDAAVILTTLLGRVPTVYVKSLLSLRPSASASNSMEGRARRRLPFSSTTGRSADLR